MVMPVTGRASDPRRKHALNSGMRNYRKDSDFAFAGTVMPEDAICAWRFVLGVRFKDLNVLVARKRAVFMDS